jgi:hypothetical protein
MEFTVVLPSPMVIRLKFGKHLEKELWVDQRWTWNRIATVIAKHFGIELFHINLEVLNAVTEAIIPNREIVDIIRKTRTNGISYKKYMNKFECDSNVNDVEVAAIRVLFDSRWTIINGMKEMLFENSLNILKWKRFFPDENLEFLRYRMFGFDRRGVN